jgi:hypothetical protein
MADLPTAPSPTTTIENLVGIASMMYKDSAVNCGSVIKVEKSKRGEMNEREKVKERDRERG